MGSRRVAIGFIYPDLLLLSFYRFKLGLVGEVWNGNSFYPDSCVGILYVFLATSNSNLKYVKIQMVAEWHGCC